jgi:hypothetical protein
LDWVTSRWVRVSRRVRIDWRVVLHYFGLVSKCFIKKCDALQSSRSLPMFRMNVLPPSSSK